MRLIIFRLTFAPEPQREPLEGRWGSSDGTLTNGNHSLALLSTVTSVKSWLSKVMSVSVPTTLGAPSKNYRIVEADREEEGQ